MFNKQIEPKYIFTKDFIANKYQPTDPNIGTTQQYLPPKKYKKGDIIDANKTPNNRLVSGGYDITPAVELYTRDYFHLKALKDGLPQKPQPTGNSKTPIFSDFEFIKPFSSTVTVGGAVGLMSKSFKIGDIVTGSEKGNGIGIRIAPHSLANEGKPSNISYQEFLIVPFEYLQLTNSKSKLTNSKQNLFTPKNIIIGVLAIGTLLGLLKWQKVI